MSICSGVKTMEIKGYIVSVGYMGFVSGKYILFETEGAYLEFVRGV